MNYRRLHTNSRILFSRIDEDTGDAARAALFV